MEQLKDFLELKQREKILENVLVKIVGRKDGKSEDFLGTIEPKQTQWEKKASEKVYSDR